MTVTKASGCPRCGAPWEEIGPDGGRCPRHGFLARAEIEAARAAPVEAPMEAETGLAGEPEDGAALLDEVASLVRRFVVLSPEQADAIALFVAHTHAIAAAEATPYLSITSPEKRSGKTRLLEVLDLLAARPWLTGRVTPAVLYRKVDRDAPTLLLDESDAAFKGEKEYAEALRGVLNTGHRRGGMASVCEKAKGGFELRDYSTFSAKAIAGIGKLPDTVADRAIIMSLKRRAPTERIERFRRSLADAEAEPIRMRVSVWAQANVELLKDARPDVPAALDDRAMDGWEPLLSIADLAGGDWPQRARAAALLLSAGASREEESMGVRLLADVRAVFEDRGVDRLASGELCGALNSIEEAPWGDLRGKPIDPRRLARLLRSFEIRPVVIRMGTETPRGYTREQFSDGWERYLSSTSPGTATSATSATDAPAELNLEDGRVADVADVAANPGIRERQVCPHQTQAQVDERYRRSEARGAHVGVCTCCGGPTANPVTPDGVLCNHCREPVREAARE